MNVHSIITVSSEHNINGENVSQSFGKEVSKHIDAIPFSLQKVSHTNTTPHVLKNLELFYQGLFSLSRCNSLLMLSMAICRKISICDNYNHIYIPFHIHTKYGKQVTEQSFLHPPLRILQEIVG